MRLPYPSRKAVRCEMKETIIITSLKGKTRQEIQRQYEALGYVVIFELHRG